MTGINVNQRGVIQSQLKGQRGVQEAQQAEAPTETNIEGRINALITNLAKGILPFPQFKKALIDLGVTENTIKVTTLVNGTGSYPSSKLQFKTNTKLYTFYVPTEYVTESPEPDTASSQGTKGPEDPKGGLASIETFEDFNKHVSSYLRGVFNRAKQATDERERAKIMSEGYDLAILICEYTLENVDLSENEKSKVIQMMEGYEYQREKFEIEEMAHTDYNIPTNQKLATEMEKYFNEARADGIIKPNELRILDLYVSKIKEYGGFDTVSMPGEMVIILSMIRNGWTHTDGGDSMDVVDPNIAGINGNTHVFENPCLDYLLENLEPQNYAAYKNYLEVDTSTPAGRREALDLLSQVVSDPLFESDDIKEPSVKNILLLIRSRYAYLEQQVRNDEITKKSSFVTQSNNIQLPSAR